MRAAGYRRLGEVQSDKDRWLRVWSNRPMPEYETIGTAEGDEVNP